MCTNKVAIETHSRTRGAKRRAFGRPERSERRGGLLFVVPVDSPVDSTFERSENFAIAHTVSSSSCYSMCILTNASFKFVSVIMKEMRR